jgi:hypothetical protein
VPTQNFDQAERFRGRHITHSHDVGKASGTCMTCHHKRHSKRRSFFKLHLLLGAGNVAIALLAARLLILYCVVLSRIFGLPVVRNNGGVTLVFALSATTIFLIGYVVSLWLCRHTDG